jgi:hypothetical protein
MSERVPDNTHQSLDGATPDQAYFTELPLRAAAYPPAELPLIDAEILFKDSGPPLSH